MDIDFNLQLISSVEIELHSVLLISSVEIELQTSLASGSSSCKMSKNNIVENVLSDRRIKGPTCKMSKW